MPAKIELLNEFYSTMDKTQVKIETKAHGFDYLKYISSLANLKYSEWVNGLYRYRLTEIEPDIFNHLLKRHIDKKLNICIYFNEIKNNIFCFNLDSFNKNKNEIKEIAVLLNRNLGKLQIKPLILKSGRGYHFWCRLSSAFENSQLQSFMKSMIDITVFEAVMQNINLDRLQCICYPRFNSHDVSIRLFGSNHTETGKFLSVMTNIEDDGSLLDEEQSWRYFENYIKSCTIGKESFGRALTCAAKLASIIK